MKKLILIITLATATQLSAFPYLIPEELGAKGNTLIDTSEDIKTETEKSSCVITYHNNIIISKFTCDKVNEIINDSKVLDK